MRHPAPPAANPQDSDPSLVMVLLVESVTGVPADLPTASTDDFCQQRKPILKNFREAIVRSRNVEYYYCIFVGNRADLLRVLMPGFFYPFLQFSDTVNRHFLLFPQTTARVSTHIPLAG